MSFPLLTVLALLPLLGALATFVAGRAGRTVGMAFALATLALGLVAFFSSTSRAEDHLWISSIGAHYALSLDGIGKSMVLLTVVVVPIVLLAEWNLDREVANGWSTGAFFANALLLESAALFVFTAADALLFYLFFEASLVPMYFLIGGWGGPRRGAAALKFLLFSLLGGLVMLLGIVGLGVHSASTGAPSLLLRDLAALHIDGTAGRWLFASFFVAFAIKAPLVPVHTWLPDAAEQATPGASTLLVSILDKIGTLGMIRFCLMLFPAAAHWATPLVLTLAVVSILYGALMAIGSRNLLRLVSYTSVSHFGFMVLGIWAFTSQSMNGTLFYMLNHGFSTAALFLAVGYIVKRRGTAQIDLFGGVQSHAPVAAGMFLVAGLAAMALPGMSSFISEFTVMAGAWQRHPVITAISTLGTVLAALYVLLAYQRTMTGPTPEAVADDFRNNDLTGRERLALAPLVALLLVFGFMPRPLMQVTDNTVRDTMHQVGMTDPAPVVKGAK